MSPLLSLLETYRTSFLVLTPAELDAIHEPMNYMSRIIKEDPESHYSDCKKLVEILRNDIEAMGRQMYELHEQPMSVWKPIAEERMRLKIILNQLPF